MTIIERIETEPHFLLSLDELSERIRDGRQLFISGDEAVLRQLPRGRWIGGTIPYFITERGGVICRSKAYAWEVPPLATGFMINRYDSRSISSVYVDAPDSGFSLIVMPAASGTLKSFALNSPLYENFACRPLIGWVSGVRLPEVGKVSPKVFDGRNGAAFEDAALVMHVALPKSKMAEINIVNIFEPGEGDILTFDIDGFSPREVFVNGKRRLFVDYLAEKNLDIRLPLVADCHGAMINTSFIGVDSRTKEVRFCGPVFRDVRYRHARPVGDYQKVFSSQLEAIVGTEISYSANCVLNYLYAGLEGRAVSGPPGPATFGEIAYQLLNQTLVYMRIVDTNLAERLRREMEQRKQFRALQVLTQELSSYDFTVSHDLRSPLRRISWFSQMLQRAPSVASDEQARQWAGKIESSAAKMARLLDHLLEFSSAGHRELCCEGVDLNTLVEGLRQELVCSEEGRRVSWRVERLPVVVGDECLLRQAFANLMSNAVKFTQPKPHPEIEIGARVEGSRDVVFVRDNGVGFDPREADYLFKPFHRLESSESFHGTGLGLAIVARAVERHGGHAWAESDPGRGACFFLALPQS